VRVRSEKDLGPLSYAVCERGDETVGSGQGEMGFGVKCLLVESSYGLKHAVQWLTSQLIMYQGVKEDQKPKEKECDSLIKIQTRWILYDEKKQPSNRSKNDMGGKLGESGDWIAGPGNFLISRGKIGVIGVNR